MIARSCAYCDRTLQLLLKTLVGILMLRAGPDALPRSWFLLGLSLVAVIAVTVAGEQIIVSEVPLRHSGLIATVILGIAAYWVILQIAGRSQRFVQTVTASAGCGVLLGAISTVSYLVIQPAIGMQNAFDIRFLVLIWSLTVDGHIIARATDQHLLAGISLATAIFILQIVIYSFS